MSLFINFWTDKHGSKYKCIPHSALNVQYVVEIQNISKWHGLLAFLTTLFRLCWAEEKNISSEVIYFDIHLLLFLHTTFTFYKAACKIRFQRKIARFLVVTVVNQQCETHCLLKYKKKLAREESCKYPTVRHDRHVGFPNCSDKH